MNVYKGRLLKKSSNRKSKLVLSTLVTTWLSNIAFHLRPIWLQTLVAIDSESCLTSFPSFCAPPSEVAALFNSNLSRRPFLGQVVDLDTARWPTALHRIRFGTCCFVPGPISWPISARWLEVLRSIPGSSQLRKKCGVGQDSDAAGNCKFCLFEIDTFF